MMHFVAMQVDPRQRLTIGEVLERLAAIGETRKFNLKAGLKVNCVAAVATNQQHAPVPPSSPQPPPRRPPLPSTSSPMYYSAIRLTLSHTNSFSSLFKQTNPKLRIHKNKN